MLKHTFTFIPGIGQQTELKLWNHGVTTWDDLKQHPREIPHSRVSKSALEQQIDNAEAALERGDVRYFADRLNQTNFWRLIGAFPDEVCYLDIETTGLSWYYDHITTVATFDGRTPRLFVKDHNLEEIVEYLNDHQILVTFNGKRFDQRFLEERFPEYTEPPVHLDLRYLARSVDLTGSLKDIEQNLDIERPEVVNDFEGRQAPVLWRQFLRGDNDAFRRLAIYNIYDTINLAELLEEILQRKLEALESDISKRHYQQTLDSIAQDTIEPFHNGLLEVDDLIVGSQSIQVEELSEGLAVKINGTTRVVVNQDNVNTQTHDVEALVEAIEERNGPAVSIGIDLSGSADSPTGFCVLDGTTATMDIVATDEEILNRVFEVNPTVVSIDSPLTLPEGRCCTDPSCECSEHGIIRECERELKQRGVNAYPCLIDSMRGLTKRGRKLSRAIEEHGIETIESYPGAAQDVLNIPRKQVSLDELEEGLRATGISITELDRKISNDELDALTSALVGHFYLAGSYEHVGRSADSGIIIPDLSTEHPSETPPHQKI